MTLPHIVDPAQIESELRQIWEGLSDVKMRACLFNLIIYNRFSPRTDYVQNIVQKVIEKFPCRILFISHDFQSSKDYLKTGVSVVAPNKEESSIACDRLDIGVGGNLVEQVPFLLFPHIVPDLPVYLLWTEDPSVENPLFESLSKLSSRIIFDSECADDLLAFSRKVLSLKKATGFEVADLNWARTEGWRDLLASTFDSQERLFELENLDQVQITYNRRETESFCHLKVQSLYLLAWLSSRLQWKLKKSSKELSFQFERGGKSLLANIQSTLWPKLGAGTIVSVELKTKGGHLYQCMRLPERYHYVGIQISSLEKCDLPYQYLLGQTATGQSLVKEITRRGTSAHYLEMLGELIQFNLKKS